MLPEEALLLSLAAVLDEDEPPLPNRPLHQPPPVLPEPVSYTHLELRVTFCAPPAYNGIENERKVVGAMQVVVLKSPKCLRGLLRRLFGIKKETQD